MNTSIFFKLFLFIVVFSVGIIHTPYPASAFNSLPFISLPHDGCLAPSTIASKPIASAYRDGEQLVITVKKGDHLKALIKRYQLDKDECNLAYFYKKNNIKKGSYLIAGRKYYLPIYVFNYDGLGVQSTIGLDDKAACARIKRYNDALYSSKVHSRHFTKSKVIWVLHHEIKCINNIVPQVKGQRIFPIFGSKHQHVPLKSNKLSGKVFYIVAGHGGPDPGAMGKYNGKDLCEDEYAYDVSLRVARNLIANGAIAYMIIRDPDDGIRSGDYLPHDKDEYCYPNQYISQKQGQRLHSRSDAVNELYDKNLKKGRRNQRLVMIHIDSSSETKSTDVFFYHYPKNYRGKQIAQNISTVLRQKYKKYQPTRGYNGSIRGRNLHMLRETKPTGVYIELGNIRNKNDQKRFTIESNRQALADWLYEGLVKDY